MKTICFCLPILLIGIASTAFSDDVPLTSASSYYLSAADITNNVDKVNRGDADAAFRLYLYYEFDIHPTTNGIYWLKKASDLGSAPAECTLAQHYEYFVHPPQYEQAMKLYLSSADKGVAEAMIALAEMYENGRGVDVSIDSAITWYEKAANKGKVFCMESAASLLSKQHKNERAYVWTKIASIRRERAKIKANNSLLMTLSSNLATNELSKLDGRAIQLDRTIPYFGDYTDW